ncbi:MAG TPA: alpha/beta hydrolase domain-containing protein, partial [Pseudolabrys sp.]|nr:alpha/beta hydrolase domain-containing protein [Pseudolabrys sp.]
TGIASGEVNPNNPQNAVITDINLAPRNARGNVEYQHNFYILKPIDLSKGNHKMMYEPPNRGGKTFGTVNNTPTAGNDPGSLTDATALAGSFFWPQGYTTVWSGWENNLGPLTGFTATASFPVLHGPGNSTITGPGYEYIVTGASTYTLAYPAASASKLAPNAVLTHRVHLDDTPVVVDPSGWDYTDATNTAIKLTTGNFVANDIYEFSYIAKDPTPNGLGLAAIRDFVSFLRNAKMDDVGTPNPIAGDVKRVYTYTLSQPARLLNDFTHLGFNEDEQHRQVVDGMMQWVGAGDGLNMNYRWSQTKRTERNRQEQLYLEGLYPFANVPTFDPISRTVDWRYRKCEQTRTCPLALEFYSANEYWVKPASLMSTDPTGRVDLPDHPLTRLYLLSSAQHASAGNPASKGSCQQFLNPLPPQQVERALWQDLDQWSTRGILPPSSQVPKLRDHTLVPPLPQSVVGFPNIPGVTYTGLKTTRYRFNYGPNFYQTGIPTINPPVIHPPYEDNPANGPIYPSYVPKTDKDGNDIAGIRLPDVTVPLATYTGWALRAGAWANDGCEGSGQYIPFARTKADRLASGDPRLSVEERYATYDQYHALVINAVDQLVRKRFMLCSDADAYVATRLAAGVAAGVPAATHTLVDTVPSCVPHTGHGHDHGHGHGHGH